MRNFDFTPDPRVLIALTHTAISPMDALCELIDNSIDSFYSARLHGNPIENPIINIRLPRRSEVEAGTGVIYIRDNGPGMSPDDAEKAIKAGFSSNNQYDALGLFGMGFNISTGKFGIVTTLLTSQKKSPSYLKTVINLSELAKTRNYSLPVEVIEKGINTPFDADGSGTIVEIRDWWPEGNANSGFILKLIRYGLPKIREEIGRRYATLLRQRKMRISINDELCEPYEHCVWSEKRSVVRNGVEIPAKIVIDKVVGTSKRCTKCKTIIDDTADKCPACDAVTFRTIEERITGWIGIQRFDHESNFGIDLIRNGRTIRPAEKSAFFEYVDDLKNLTKDYPIDQQYGRIVGEIHLDFVPVDFSKQDFNRSSIEWQKSMEYLRGNSSLQPKKPGADENNSPLFKLYQGYRRVRKFGRGDMYMGSWDPTTKQAQRISRKTEEEYYQKFKDRVPGYFDDEEWWKLVESADVPPAEPLPACPTCGSQNLKEAEVCSVCSAILHGKKCIDSACGATIPASAVSCPCCGKSQIAEVINPWKCDVCGKKNIATDDICKSCKSPRGTTSPISADELLKNSDKIDSLSIENLVVPLTNQQKSAPLNIEVYSTRQALETPRMKGSVPVISVKKPQSIQVFLDLSHPYFTECGLSKEQLVASEIALYVFNAGHSGLNNYPEHNISNIVWSVLQTAWKDSITISAETVYADAKCLLEEIRGELAANLGMDARNYCDLMTDEEKRAFARTFITNISEVAKLMESGKYLNYVPFSFILTLFNDDPKLFFDGKVWNTSISDVTDSGFFDADTYRKIVDQVIQKYKCVLQELIINYENQASDLIDLQRMRLGIDFLRREMK